MIKPSNNKHLDMHLVINFSGGKDSCAMLDYLCKLYPDTPKSVVMADTGWEHEDAITWSTERVAEYGLKLHVVKSTTKNYLSMVRDRGMFPSAQYRQCTSDLKRSPIQKWIRNNIDSKLIINCTGIRSAESPQRTKQKPLKRDKGMTNSKRTVWNWMPIKDWSDQRVMTHLSDNNIPLHPVYDYLPRFSCRLCIFNTDRQILAIKENDPQAFETIAKLEEEIGFTMKDGKSLRQIAEEQTNKRQIVADTLSASGIII
tara:strand:+ start:22864 stop:23634 length:771 start_codon:yes stop_codon:yes gene_type:complete